MNLRADAQVNPIKEGDPVEIGSNERYVAMCRKHFTEATACFNGEAADAADNGE